ncbi:MAG: hypothetical protein ACD_46C00389G0007 [uncultured bacterium]|nr:MAG: hypothetical protein ACD_46C00389G0007 [uncultured bacterium]OGT47554.1 MAG: hypothetical protein A3E83_06625 [Gammaproteobacteria bacterium RIFCSPHIGHO2_12_FULL_41_20]HLB43568.1 TylF/MycF/NovP-related O-methyltransferase [Gammaproteobacteria bacterium]
MQIDLNIYPGTRISRVNPVIQPFAVALRELLKPFKKYTKEKLSYKGDGITTSHNCDFLYTEKFIKAYAKCYQSHGSLSINLHWRIHQALWCSAIAQHLQGDIIEFGVGNGLVMSSVLEVYEDWENSNKKLILVDTFSPHNVDHLSGKQDSSQPINPFYAKSLEYVKSNFAAFKNVEFVIGFIPNILSAIKVDNLSFVHIDMNYYAPEIAALEFCWEKIVEGGVILLDDYAYNGHHEQYSAMNVLAKKLNFEILTTPTGQGIIIKSRR